MKIHIAAAVLVLLSAAASANAQMAAPTTVQMRIVEISETGGPWDQREWFSMNSIPLWDGHMLADGIEQQVDPYKVRIVRSPALENFELADLDTVQPEMLRRVVGDGVDLLVVGYVFDRFDNQVAPGFIIHRAVTRVRVIDLRDGSIATFTHTSKAGQANDEKAAVESFHRVVREFAPKVVDAIRSKAQ